MIDAVTGDNKPSELRVRGIVREIDLSVALASGDLSLLADPASTSRMLLCSAEIYIITGSGDLAYEDDAGVQATLTNLAAGDGGPLRARKILKTGTTLAGVIRVIW